MPRWLFVCLRAYFQANPYLDSKFVEFPFLLFLSWLLKQFLLWSKFGFWYCIPKWVFGLQMSLAYAGFPKKRNPFLFQEGTIVWAQFAIHLCPPKFLVTKNPSISDIFKLGRWDDGTNESLTKRLMFQVLFFFMISCWILCRNTFNLFVYFF